MCGVLLMNVEGSRRAPSRTSEPQKVFVVMNCEWMPMAFVMSTLPSGIDFHDVYRHLIRGMEALALWVTSRTQRGSLPFYQSVIYLVLVAGVGLAVIANDTWNIRFTLFDTPLDFIVAVVLIIVAVAATRAKKRFTAVVVTGISGYAMVVYFAFVGSPDLALTQVLVETITIVVFVLVRLVLVVEPEAAVVLVVVVAAAPRRELRREPVELLVQPVAHRHVASCACPDCWCCRVLPRAAAPCTPRAKRDAGRDGGRRGQAWRRTFQNSGGPPLTTPDRLRR